MEVSLLSFTNPSLSIRPTFLSLPNQHSAASFSVPNQTHVLKSIVCARNNRRRIGSRRSKKFLIDSVYFIATRLNILPEPLALAIRSFRGGNGGGNGNGVFRGFGGGGSGGWRRQRKIKIGFLGFVIACGVGMWMLLREEGSESDLFLGVMGMSLLGFSAVGWRRETKDWVLGFCFCAVLVGLGLGREDLQRWTKGFKPLEIVGRKRGRRRGTA